MWEDGLFEGQGTNTCKTENEETGRQEQTSIEGTWKLGLPHGQGICNYPDGSKYDGLWVKGYPHGKGKKYNVDGSTYDGEWKLGKATGKGTKELKNKTIFVGEWLDSEIVNGRCTFNYSKEKIDYFGDFS